MSLHFSWPQTDFTSVKQTIKLQDGLHIWAHYNQKHITQIHRVKQIAGGRAYQLILTGIQHIVLTFFQ